MGNANAQHASHDLAALGVLSAYNLRSHMMITNEGAIPTTTTCAKIGAWTLTQQHDFDEGDADCSHLHALMLDKSAKIKKGLRVSDGVASVQPVSPAGASACYASPCTPSSGLFFARSPSMVETLDECVVWGPRTGVVDGSFW